MYTRTQSCGFPDEASENDSQPHLVKHVGSWIGASSDGTLNSRPQDLKINDIDSGVSEDVRVSRHSGKHRLSSGMTVNNEPTARREGSKGPTVGATDGAELFRTLRNDMRDNKAADNAHLFTSECETSMAAEQGSRSQERIDMR